jgi:hypothetical protein
MGVRARMEKGKIRDDILERLKKLSKEYGMNIEKLKGMYLYELKHNDKNPIYRYENDMELKTFKQMKATFDLFSLKVKRNDG